MLVITRKAGTSFKIGKDVKVHVLSMDKNQIKIGIEAPKDVLILRTELEKKS